MLDGVFFCGTVVHRRLFYGPTGGARDVVWRVMGFAPQQGREGVLEEVNSIDLIIVGLGLVLVLLVLLRR